MTAIPGDEMSKPWIGTSWKMTKRLSEAVAYAEALAGLAAHFAHLTNSFVLPAFPLIESVARVLRPAGVSVGAQNVHWMPSGAFTGEVSAPMLIDVGASIVAIGHAERRAMFGETDQTVRDKVGAALASGLRTLVCVGESVKIALGGLTVTDLAGVLVAYEPVWAIGEGSTPATPAQANDMHGQIRAAIAHLFGGAGTAVPLLYGGSVTRDGAPALIAQDQIDGLFVGRAAWTVEGFAAIARTVAETGGRVS
ncbi:MAG: triosephosphate isomerase (TIM) [Acidimicrobiaceae bacterium]|nr:MAG: triosephosphate isomerase (TIM) [Acidimicrobiaceae bacterium]